MTTKVALYCRVSTTDQYPENQVRVLTELAQKNDAEIVATFIDKGISGVKKDRDALNQMMSAARSRKFSTLYVLSIDRLSRSVKNLIETVETLNELGITIVFQRENIDTKSAMGQFFLTVLGSLAQFEREIMRSRTIDGLAAARARGRKGGRKPAMTQSKIQTAKSMYEQGKQIKEIAEILGVSRPTIYRALESN